MKADPKPSTPTRVVSGAQPVRTQELVAEIVGMSVHQVKYIESQALRKLGEALRRWGYDTPQERA